MKPEPLKGKDTWVSDWRGHNIRPICRGFSANDIRSAVEWMKKKLSVDGVLDDYDSGGHILKAIIDEAFEDVMK